MPRNKRHRDRDDSRKPAEKKAGFVSPFKDLKKMLAARGAVLEATPKPAPIAAAKPAPPPEPPETDDDIFRRAVEGARPIGDERGSKALVEPLVNRKIVSEDAEVIARLFDLVSGQGNFDVTETDEYVEGARVGLDPRLLSQLRRGEFAMQAHLDLHGLIQPDAKTELDKFVLESVRRGLRAVLIVHGRGLRSPGGRPVLKHAAVEWLSHGSIGGHVLAFSSARIPDGGVGAMYVLLRRDKRRAPFDILQGAKRRD
jgi:DNA-nicking Smr family endonuclease